MAKDYLVTITFEDREISQGGRIYRGFLPGDLVRGKISFTASKRIKCRGLQVEAGMQEHGQGSSAENRLIDRRFHEGEVQAGQTIEKEFELTIPPEGPPTYEGHYVNFTWFVRTRVDIPMWFDKRDEVTFRVLCHSAAG